MKNTEQYCLCKNDWNSSCKSIKCDLNVAKGQLRQIQSLQQKFEKKLLEGSKKCIYTGCNKLPVKSHTISESQLRKACNEENKVWVLNVDFINLLNEKKIFRFEKVGVGEALVFAGFCQEHESTLFKFNNVDIDLCNFNPDNEEAFITLLYRVVSRQFKIIQYQQELWDEAQKNPGFKLFLDKLEITEKDIEEDSNIWEALKKYKSSFLAINENILNQLITNSLKRKKGMNIFNKLLKIPIKPQFFKRYIELDGPPAYLGFGKLNIFKLNFTKNFVLFNSYVNNNKWILSIHCFLNDTDNINKIKEIPENDIPYFMLWHILMSGNIIFNPSLVNQDLLEKITTYINNEFIHNDKEQTIEEKIKQIRHGLYNFLG